MSKRAEAGYFRRRYVLAGPMPPFHQYWVNRGLYGGGPRSSLTILMHRLHVHYGHTSKAPHG